MPRAIQCAQLQTALPSSHYVTSTAHKPKERLIMVSANTQIKIAIPSDEVDLVDYFEQLLEDEFREVLDFDVVAQSHRAVLDEVRVTDVTVMPDGIEIEYSFQYSAYLGCRDMTMEDGETSSVVGQKDGAIWVFDKHTPWQPRSTDEEF